jgi:hypothetical protein
MTVVVKMPCSFLLKRLVSECLKALPALLRRIVGINGIRHPKHLSAASDWER